ncbi:hypothetical protein MCW82_30545 [Azospirillum doebereinerae]|nr:hypothetical protein [Azospirillum doebereinerae]MCG5244112.1 hypothetical protein [Azospirillum doebereinerae]
MTDVIQPHPFAFPEATLDDLRERLTRAGPSGKQWMTGARARRWRRCRRSSTTGGKGMTGGEPRRG